MFAAVSPTPRGARSGLPGLLYAGSAFVGTWVFFTWFVIFLGNLPKRSHPWITPTVDHGAAAEPVSAALANALLLAVFCLQHSLMARPRFKRMLATYMPPELERATYVHAANLTGFLFLALWTPIPAPVWSIDNTPAETVIWTGFGLGWLILLLAALSMGVTELLGLRQAWHWYRGRPAPPLELKTSWLYRYMEHPMYVGVLLGFWMTPHMTVGHALLALQLTAYIALAMGYERRDLSARFGSRYVTWRSRHSRRASAMAASGHVAGELKRRFAPIASQPLPNRMVALLARM